MKCETQPEMTMRRLNGQQAKAESNRLTEEAKKELEDLGENVDDFVVQTQSKVDAQVRALTKTATNPNGISVLDENGRLRSTYDIDKMCPHKRNLCA